jgi:transcriptional regulator with XRE-family HTH domain
VSATANSFANKLKVIREQKGVSQYTLAKLTGLSRQALSRLELGEREPAWVTVQLIATALGVDCRAFADADIELPEQQHANPPGRPRKATADVETPAPKTKPAKLKSKKK